MINLDRVTYSKLKKYEVNFRQAVYGMSYSGVTAQKITDIYNIVKPLGYNKKINSSCNGCRLKFLQEIGTEYFNFQKQLSTEMAERRRKKKEGE